MVWGQFLARAFTEQFKDISVFRCVPAALNKRGFVQPSVGGLVHCIGPVVGRLVMLSSKLVKNIFLRILNDLDNAYDLQNVGRSDEEEGVIRKERRGRSDERGATRRKE